MNQDEIISMAEECGLPLTYVPHDDTFSPHVDGLVAFANLVAARAAKDAEAEWRDPASCINCGTHNKNAARYEWLRDHTAITDAGVDESMKEQKP